MGWIKDCVDIAASLAAWSAQRFTSSGWQKRLKAVKLELMRPNPDIAAADELVYLAHEAGFTGRELDEVEQRIQLVKDHDERARPGGTSRSGKKGAKKKPSSKKSSKKKLSSKKSKKKRPATSKGNSGKASPRTATKIGVMRSFRGTRR